MKRTQLIFLFLLLFSTQTFAYRDSADYDESKYIVWSNIIVFFFLIYFIVALIGGVVNKIKESNKQRLDNIKQQENLRKEKEKREREREKNNILSQMPEIEKRLELLKQYFPIGYKIVERKVMPYYEVYYQKYCLSNRGEEIVFEEYTYLSSISLGRSDRQDPRILYEGLSLEERFGRPKLIDKYYDVINGKHIFNLQKAVEIRKHEIELSKKLSDDLDKLFDL
jgi:hypothetical protein